MRDKANKGLLQFTENLRFVMLTLGVFCLMLGGAIALFTLMERLFFEMSFGKPFLIGIVITLCLGFLLLRSGQRRLK